MALPGSGIVNRGLQILGGKAFGTSDAFANVQCIGVDDSASNFAAADTALNTSRTAPTNVAAHNFDSTPTRASQTITMTSTFATSEGNMTIKGISLHNVTAASVTASSTSLFAGIAGQSIVKTTSFSLAITISVTLTDNS